MILPSFSSIVVISYFNYLLPLQKTIDSIDIFFKQLPKFKTRFYPIITNMYFIRCRFCDTL